MIKRLPLVVRPAQQETVTSYVRRLAALHAIPYKDMWKQLSATPQPHSGIRRLIVADQLASATGYEIAALERAMPELRKPAPDWREMRHLPQRACPACTARHPGGPVVRFFAHHEFVCIRHGYWIGPPVPTMPDLQPRRLAHLIPELLPAQQHHNRLLRRHGWRDAFTAVSLSIPVCVDQRFHEPVDAPLRRRWKDLVDQLIPTHHTFNTSVFLAVFYPEIVNLARLFCSRTWRDVAHRALTSGDDRLAIATEISRVIGREPVIPYDPNGHETGRWLRALSAPLSVFPAQTFPKTRRVTPDGIPKASTRAEERLAHKAAAEFHKHRHVPSWALPDYANHPPEQHIPLDYQVPAQREERRDLHQLLGEFQSQRIRTWELPDDGDRPADQQDLHDLPLYRALDRLISEGAT
jgi:hypothetical protein